MRIEWKWLLAAALPGLLAPAAAGQTQDPPGAAAAADTHDLRLPDWGPYSNAYLGLSHIPDPASGMRFDLTAFAGPHTTSTPDVPNASLNTGFVAWEAAPDLSYYAYRQKIEGQAVYAELSFAALDADTRLIRADLVNGSDRARTLTLNLLASMQLPNRGANQVLTPRRILKAALPPDARWVSAVHYAEHRRATPTPQDRLVYDGWLRGEVRGDGYVDGRALRMARGDFARYAVPIGAESVVLRYRAATDAGLAATGVQTRGIAVRAAPEGASTIVRLTPDARTLTLTADAALDLEGLAFVRSADADRVRFDPEDSDTRPEATPGPGPNTLLLKYRQASREYGLRWFRPDARIREFRNGTLDFFFARHSHSKGLTVAHGDGRGHYTNLLFGGTLVPAGGRETLWAVVTSGAREAVENRLSEPVDIAALERIWTQRRQAAAPPPHLPAGERYQLSRQLIAANLLMNVVYPVYTQDRFIRHFTPGKWWDSLYTWDSGFIGIGLADVAPRLSTDVLHAYTTAPGAQSAFIHHGTPLPVQHHQLLELWNRTQDRAMLAHAYPRLRQYYDYLIGRAPGSTTAALRSGLLATWPLFYNSGGWDDLPPQVQVHAAKLEARVAPMVTSAHAIRAAKILRMAARELGERDDIAAYDKDIARLSAAIQAHGWDPESGYFGYVLHDAEGQANGLLRTSSGENANKTLDGVQPLIAGITTLSQTRALLAHLRDPAALSSPIGITAVDQSAGYYRPDGYWNGTVWFPHQWFVWKALLDQGEGELAWQVARTALDLYDREARHSWNSSEHFEIATGQGAGWHQFSGLSAPIANWYHAYFVPGRLSTGYDVWVRRKTFDPGLRGMRAELRVETQRTRGVATVVVTLAPDRHYVARWNGRVVEAVERHRGAYEIRLPLDGVKSGVLDVLAAGDEPRSG